jgi:hypothetical protein
MKALAPPLLLLLAALAAVAVATTGAQPPPTPTPPQAAARSHGGGSGSWTDVAFQGSALLINYYAGASGALQKGGVIVPRKTRIAGLSGGGYTAVLTTLGWRGPRQKAFWDAAIKTNVLEYRGPFLNAVMYEALDAALPSGVARLINGFVRIAVSQLDAGKTTFVDSASWILSAFADKRDVIAALTTTDMIPCFSSWSTYGVYKNQPVIDGGFSTGFKELCGAGNANCLKVSSYVVGSLASHECTGKCSAFSSNCVANDRLDIRTRPYVNGKFVDRWPIAAVQGRCPTATFKTKDPNPLPPFVPHGQLTPDIHPGKYNPLPDGMAACEWQDWALSPPTDPAELDDMLNKVYELGYADARAYLQQELGITIDADPY